MPAGKNTYDDEIMQAYEEALRRKQAQDSIEVDPDAPNMPVGEIPLGKPMAQPLPLDPSDIPDETVDVLRRARRDQLGMRFPAYGPVQGHYRPGGKYRT